MDELDRRFAVWDMKEKIADLTRQLAEAREQLEVCQRLSDTFWDALKPLGLKEIYLSCPGQHVVDLIRERDMARDEIARLRNDYMEIIMAVRQKYPFETRHQTALRYIEERENYISCSTKQALEASNGRQP